MMVISGKLLRNAGAFFISLELVIDVGLLFLNICIHKINSMKNTLLFFFCFSFVSVYGQILVSPDSSFGVNGRVAIEVGISSSGESGMGRRVLKMLPNGKMLIATTAKINEFNSNRNYWIGQLNSDGTLDELFGTEGRTVIFSGNDGVGNALVAVDTDLDNGVIVLGERKDPFTVIEEAVVKRLFSDGSVDNSFGVAGERIFRLSPIGSFTRARDLKVLANGKILVLMDTRYSSTNPVGLGNEYCVARLNSNGSIDSSFAENGFSFIIDATLNDLASKIAVRENGKIILAGTVSVSGISKYRFIQLNENGSLDEEFGINGSVIVERGNESAVILNDLIIDANGAILATGNASQMLTIVRLDSSGFLDEEFNEIGYLNIPALDIGNKLLIDEEGFIYAVGREFNQVLISKLNSQGDLISDFGSQGVASLGTANPSSSDLTAAFSNDGNLFIAGAWFNNDKDFYSMVKVKFANAGIPSNLQSVELNSLIVYPNPGTSFIRVNKALEDEFYQIVNSRGQQVFEGILLSDGFIQTERLNAGMYILHFPGKGLFARFSKVD